MKYITVIETEILTREVITYAETPEEALEQVEDGFGLVINANSHIEYELKKEED